MTNAPEFPPGWEELDPDDHELSDNPSYQEAREDARQRRQVRTDAQIHLLRELR